MTFGVLLYQVKSPGAGPTAVRFELSRRRDNLTFSHHAEVAALTPAEADVMIGAISGLRAALAALVDASAMVAARQGRGRHALA